MGVMILGVEEVKGAKGKNLGELFNLSLQTLDYKAQLVIYPKVLKPLIINLGLSYPKLGIRGEKWASHEEHVMSGWHENTMLGI